MAFTPIDPTKAEVRTTQVGTQLQFDFYIPRGATGAPGGYTQGTDLGNYSLDGVTAPGLYRNWSASVATAQNNYPVINASTVVEVLTAVAPADVIQRATPVAGGLTGSGQVMYVRRFVSGSWTAWKTYASTRVDQTAGRAIYQWDDLNNREQLIYGDTGWRSIVALSVSGTGNLHIRRTGQLVTLNAVGWSNTVTNAAYAVVFAAGQLAGFAPTITARGVAITAAGLARIVDITPSNSGGEIRLFNPENPATYSFSMTWPTDVPWPTTLPGTASGSIPNT